MLLCTRGRSAVISPAAHVNSISSLLRNVMLSSDEDHVPDCHPLRHPDCDWGFRLSDASEMGKCYEAFRLHCVALHGVAAYDTEAAVFCDRSFQLRVLRLGVR
jgi:hypothetical protein